MFSHHRHSAFSASLTSCLALVLLLLYVAGSVQIEGFHHLLHAEEVTELHSLQHEQDSCHKAIYHQETENTCDHSSHVVQLKKCPVCELSFQTEHLTSSVTILYSASGHPDYVSWAIHSEPSARWINLPSRAPPVL